MLLIYALFALDMLNMSLFLPIFNKYILSLGGSHSFIGLIATCTALIGLIWKPIAGNLSDTKGRKIIVIWCTILYLVGNIVMYLNKSLYGLFVSRALCAFGSPLQTLFKTIMSDNTTDGKGPEMNKIGAILSISFMGGALLGGFLSEYSFDLIILLICINLVISLVLATLLPDGRSIPKNKNHLIQTSSFKKIQLIYNSIQDMQWSHYWDVFTIKGLLDLSFGIMQMSIGFVLLYEFNIDGRYIGYIFCLLGVVGIITNLISVKLSHTYYKEDKGYLRILHGCALLTLSYLGLGLSSIYYVFLFWFATQSVARTILEPSLFELLNDKVNVDEKGTVLSLFDGLLSLSELISPILSSTLLTFFGEKKTILICSIPATVGFSIAYFKKNRKIKLN